MSRRGAAWLAWSLCALAIRLYLASAVFIAVDSETLTPGEYLVAVALFVLPVVGALVAMRQPGNAIGWLFCGAGLLTAASGASYSYADYVLNAHRDLPGGVAAAWLTSWVFLPALIGISPLLFLLFPDGRPHTLSRRIAVAATVVALTCQAAAAAFRPGPMQDTPVSGVQNPAGITAHGLLDVVETAGWTLGLLSIAFASCSLALRVRRSRGVEHLQLRLFAFSAVLFLLACLISAMLFQTRLAELGQGLVFAAFCTIPIATAIAILRYRLYNIDIVINRTLVYGSLTATLAGVYLGSVLLFQLVLRPFTDQSELAVAGSTLAVAALFGPVRARIQATVDRRFFRQRYDAARTLEVFTGRLRREVDLDAVGADLRAAVDETVQPAHLTLWLRT